MSIFITDMAKCMLDATHNGNEISYMFEEATPVKACGDLAYRLDGSGETSFLLDNTSVL